MGTSFASTPWRWPRSRASASAMLPRACSPTPQAATPRTSTWQSRIPRGVTSNSCRTCTPTARASPSTVTAPGRVWSRTRRFFKSALKKVDVTFQNLDSSEISLTDVSHYFDSDPTKLVAGLREDGKTPSAFIADTTTANAQVRTLSETLRLDARTKLLNPKFYEGMLKSGY